MKVRELFALALALAVPTAAAAQVPSSAPVAKEVDEWSHRITWRTEAGWYAAPAHATLLPDGRILFLGYERPVPSPSWTGATAQLVWTMTPTPVGQPLPGETLVTAEEVPYDAQGAVFGSLLVNDDLFCSGHTLLADGSFFSVGGSRGVWNLESSEFFLVGMSYSLGFDGVSWTRVPADMKGVATLGEAHRWYPTATRLPDGRILAIGGDELVLPAVLKNLSVEAYDPALGDWTVLSPFGATPDEIWNPDYTHALALPTKLGPFDVMMFGMAGLPVLFSTSGGWLVQPHPRPGSAGGELPNHGASTALLSVRVNDGEWGYSNGSALVAGGTHLTSHQSSVDVYDPVAGVWTHRKMSPRHHPSTVLLPDGRVLLVAGHAKQAPESTEYATYVDPARDFAVSSGRTSAGIVRGYHTVSLLLPDGRVLVGGGQSTSTGEKAEKTHFQYYYPSYFFRPRPVITAAPSVLDYGLPFLLTTTVQPPAELVLVGLGSMTHSFDMNQRHVQLEILGTSAGTAMASAPPDPMVAPPGYYMLFALDGRRTPSAARMVLLQ
jgi:hypothetical protein